MKQQILFAAIAATAILASPVGAFEAGDWTFKTGMTNVDPKQNNGSPADLDVVVDDDASLSLTGQYFFTPAVSLELLASLPFEHEYTVAGLGTGSTKHLPPTLSVQYHFNSAGKVIPYVGVGVNYTTFFSQKASGALEAFLAGSELKLDDSTGLALQAGVDYMLTDQLFFNVDVRYISIEPDAKLDGAKIGTVKINPTTVGLNIGYRF